MRSNGRVKVTNKEKGDFGEEAVLDLLKKYASKFGGIVYHSYTYPLAIDNRSGKPFWGNVKAIDGRYKDFSNATYPDEIDCILVTTNRIFPIEVKAYRRTMRITDLDLWKGEEREEKNPVMQCEKHARHLYHTIYNELPDGDPGYIVPILVFVDKCSIRDERSPEFKKHINICVLNSLIKTIQELDKPGQFLLSKTQLDAKMLKVKTSGKVVFKLI